MNSQFSRDAIRKTCQLAPIVPVLVVHDVAHARPLAQALVDGGLPALEVTLRTPAALEVIAEMAAVPGAVVGAGTVLTAEDIRAVQAAGAQFAVSPGATDALLTACETVQMPLLPGAASASEAMVLLERGYDVLKLFPAEAAGGVTMLKSLGGPLPQVSFCPTGGVNPTNAPDYLKLDNVICAGGSWVAPQDAMEAGDWKRIEKLACDASGIGS
ncbi:bifunctional 4-hydroxy-2-oxoglutarate aldolase/2-dehydro-3-deoxy-phosphogluconate aldolase [Halocynthiibacter namhaensis]|uniref:bifunctional 4-hydroxy-2-oxoglutarate aldolase/2-dehydro-3-deoxy-phosphogluconate aldolase n=1 Tax=Halocynthiibacter namhaensis TaxID=1290553 RepID=UPI000690B12B|nr:bifunctional 4-hydroxy-2-oxoglutarate aldolase/2-dehydro-3-deoxy-phosphogluconate aldolase [Halocynthiibacter namhaensis]